MITSINNDHEMIQLSMKDVAPLWYKFRDVALPANDGLHVQYCELIQEAIWLNQTNEAFRLLAEGIQWYDSIHEA